MTPERPLLVYDGDCAFCSTCARLLARFVRPAADIVTWQETDLAAFGWTSADARKEVLWAAGGQRDAGAGAISRVLSTGRGPWPAVGAVLRLPLLERLAALGYRVVARNRYRLPGGTPACAAGGERPGDPPGSRRGGPR